MGAVLKINPVEFSSVIKLLISGLILYFLHTHLSQNCGGGLTASKHWVSPQPS